MTACYLSKNYSITLSSWAAILASEPQGAEKNRKGIRSELSQYLKSFLNNTIGCISFIKFLYFYNLIFSHLYSQVFLLLKTEFMVLFQNFVVFLRDNLKEKIVTNIFLPFSKFH